MGAVSNKALPHFYMLDFNVSIFPGSVNVVASSNGPLSAEEWAKLAADKIVYIGNQTEGPIRDQAIAYKSHIQKVIEYYIKQAIVSHEKHWIERVS
jgi:hypothetical protein